MSSTCVIISPYSNVISDRSINNKALVCKMKRLSSVCLYNGTRWTSHVIHWLVHYLKTKVDWIQMLPMKSILLWRYMQEKKKRQEREREGEDKECQDIVLCNRIMFDQSFFYRWLLLMMMWWFFVYQDTHNVVKKAMNRVTGKRLFLLYALHRLEITTNQIYDILVFFE